MKELLPDKLKALGKITEIKRIFSVVQKSIEHLDNTCVVVSSGEPGEGKTTLTAGLAVSAAKENGDRVLAVDFNWYTPSLHKLFGVNLFEDADEMCNGLDIEEIVCSTNMENLDVLPAPRNFEGSEEVEAWHRAFLMSARENYDKIFVDTSSVYPTNYRMMDPIRLSNIASGVVLVALTNVTPREVVKRASVAMEASGANLIGVVANQWLNPIV